MNRIATALATTVAAAGSLVVLAAETPAVSYPHDYRDWTHVKSMLITPEHPLADPFHGIHHIYANDIAMDGYRHGEFADGAVIAFDLLEYDQSEAAITEGKRKLVGVMRRDAGAYATTAGWGFEAFAGDSTTARLVEDGGAQCFACHQAQRQADYVFSAYRE